MTATTILSDNGVSSGSAGIKTTGGNDGTLQLQTTTSGGTATTAVTIGTDQSVTFAQTANLPNTFGFKNRIINGAMGIWQRGTSGFSTASNTYTADRFTSSFNGNTGTVTQDTSVPNAQFKYSLKAVPVSNATTAEFVIRQWFEQQNVFDLAGQNVTISAWVYCSKTSVKVRNNTIANSTGGADFSQAFSITAGTWTKITCTSTAFLNITGWTSTPNQAGGFLDIGFVDGAALTTSDYLYITGVQLEKGSTATSFDYRPYGTELALCQRYYEIGTAYLEVALAGSGARAAFFKYQTSKRAAATVTLSATTNSPIVGGLSTVDGISIYNSVGNYFQATYAAAAEL